MRLEALKAQTYEQLCMRPRSEDIGSVQCDEGMFWLGLWTDALSPMQQRVILKAFKTHLGGLWHTGVARGFTVTVDGRYHDLRDEELDLT